MKDQLQALGYHVKRKYFGTYTYQITKDNLTYHVLVLPTSRSHLVTINSKYIWNIKSGAIQGARFVTRSVKTIKMNEFLKLQNPIVVFKNSPYKILKYINESEVVDITTSLDAHDLTILPTKQSIVPWLKSQGTNC
ncbi:hypothetical protein [Candidatus Xianfuyuplasma coldseepsis]|uniref:Uncharacterized protein n=1 Tax=Candidatus Xianfuyuplasma coldseepsis TaxID=2782163 RepID=A0A7L7KQ57_9MOLU|nr:hypothetical protein [Xianfuyuplasma coldseepsis]QMS84569.1 hypothetical protein G4Z02_01995 [Xianfuyuplasma coldseepsis]